MTVAEQKAEAIAMMKALRARFENGWQLGDDGHTDGMDDLPPEGVAIVEAESRWSPVIQDAVSYGYPWFDYDTVAAITASIEAVNKVAE